MSTSKDQPEQPKPPKTSPLDVESVDLGLTTKEIVAIIREGRESGNIAEGSPEEGRDQA